MSEEKKYDTVNSPKHYTDTKIEVIDYIEDKNLGFCLGNVVKYISRAGKKDNNTRLQDLKKSAWYLNREIQAIENTENEKCLEALRKKGGLAHCPEER